VQRRLLDDSVLWWLAVAVDGTCRTGGEEEVRGKTIWPKNYLKVVVTE
jgi:hypothetical protein